MSKPKYCYVVVLDGCRPDEIDSGSMANVRALRDNGRWFPRASSLPVMETLPNHVMMMTGVRPDRNGVPANAIYDRAEQAVRDLDRSTDIIFPTVIERLRRKGFVTASVLSKRYLHGIFAERADHVWKPSPEIPITEHAPDSFTMKAALDIISQHNPHFMFINLGDIDRVGHADITGSTLRLARTAALSSADTQVQRLVKAIKAKGQWGRSMIIVLADHSMDWSSAVNVISLVGELEDDALLKGNVEVAQNGGADLVYWTGPDNLRPAGVKRIVEIARATPGVLEAHEIARTPALRLGTNSGDVLAHAKSGWRFSDPAVVSNPIPGNHGHPATAPIPFFLAGGSSAVRPGVTSTHAFTIDVAPTVTDYFGLKPPRGGYDGTSRL